MTDRHAGYIVTLARDVREDDAESIVTAIRMVKGVAGVSPVKADTAQEIAAMRRDNEWRAALHRLVMGGPGGGPGHDG